MTETAAPDFKALADGLEAAMVHEKAMVQIMTLAQEYEEKAITAERFSTRCLQIIRSTYAKYAKEPA